MDADKLRSRLTELNTKAYYLLVALSFLYRTNPALSFKLALTLTAFVAALPVQDYVHSERALMCLRIFKITFLTAAFACTIWWIWDAAPAHQGLAPGTWPGT
jgi:hypothetical protein